MASSFLTAPDRAHFREALLSWFTRHKRDLPWRRTRDPYAIWVSEIMLQQTRVAAVLDHYARWMARFPTVAALAQADETEVLALWSGLGYYRRARFLHAGARAVVAEHAGTLPCTSAALRLLPGVGEYTSAAIASIAFEEPVAVVDGNVERVVTRLAGLAPGLTAAPLAQAIRSTAQELLAAAAPGDSNQAIMELGATICLPRAPLCLDCPVQPWCRTRGEHPTVPRKAMQSRSIAYALVERDCPRLGEPEVLLAQRPATAPLMAGMWELPQAPLSRQHTPGQPGEQARTLLTLRHAITVTNYQVSVLACAEHDLPAGLPGQALHWHPIAALPDIPLTGLARKALRRLERWPVPLATPQPVA